MRPYSTHPPRTSPHAIQYIRGEVGFDTPGAGVGRGLWIGTFPKGAILMWGFAKTIEGYNGSTNAVTLGTNALANNLLDTGEIAEGVPGVNHVSDATLATTVFTEDTPVYLKYAQTGTPATAGRTIVILQYVCE